ncbi:MAG: HNH endonuclease [bacterium]|nr:HNH endonuclease [bacterium]
MDRGVKFVLDNFDKTLDFINDHPEYEKYKKRVQIEYSRIKYIKFTGNMYEHFLKFKGGNHKYAEDFKFLEENGILSNELLADYLRENYSDEMDHYCGIEDLIVGNIYSNSEIANTFKCSNMGGMRRSKETNSLVLIAKHNNPLYDDQWTDDGILNYTGMGTENDQSISYAQNKTLTIAEREGIKVYLFESYKDNEYYYDGEVKLAGTPYQSEEADINGAIRKVIKFPLKRLDQTKSLIIDIEDIEKSENEKLKEVRKFDSSEIKNRAKIAESENISTKEVKTIYRERNQYIAEYTKERANGVCDLCGKEAPFKDKNGRPYLESHHVITLAENGPDAIYNTVAICPNCHRKIHVLHQKEDIDKLSKVIMKYLLTDDDKENIKKWEELFKN